MLRLLIIVGCRLIVVPWHYCAVISVDILWKRTTVMYAAAAYGLSQESCQRCVERKVVRD
jgi:hypothetical protein